jgi:hypothetical protein
MIMKGMDIKKKSTGRRSTITVCLTIQSFCVQVESHSFFIFVLGKICDQSSLWLQVVSIFHDSKQVTYG